MTSPSARIYALISYPSRKAVVFRRGPSGQVLLISWDLATDTFERGQWFKGRIYERRCDLSPSGKYLIYFAATYKEPYYSWTAISKPPYLTALVLWPKGDGWGGGGLFRTETTIALNHREYEFQMAKGFSWPKSFTKEPLGEHSGWGEDYPINAMRLIRQKWTCVQQGVAHYDGEKKVQRKLNDTLAWVNQSVEEAEMLSIRRVFAVYDPIEIWQKKNARHILEMQTLGWGEKNGSSYVLRFRVLAEDGKQILDLRRADWADWDKNGELLFAKGGRIFRLSHPKGGMKAAKELIDLREDRFRPLEAPDEFKVW